jgi:hypothetical protein
MYLYSFFIRFVILIICSMGLTLAMELDPRKGVFDLHLVHQHEVVDCPEAIADIIKHNLGKLNQAQMLEECITSFQPRVEISYKYGLIHVINVSSKSINFEKFSLLPDTCYTFTKAFDRNTDQVCFNSENSLLLNVNYLTPEHTETAFTPHESQSLFHNMNCSDVFVFFENSTLVAKAKSHVLAKYDEFSKRDNVEYLKTQIPQFKLYMENPQAYAEALNGKDVIFTYKDLSAHTQK